MTSRPGLTAIQVRPGYPEFLDLPWNLPLARWRETCDRIVEVERGLSRHDVVFVSDPQGIFALKELPPDLAVREYETLRGLEKRGLPAVTAIGHARTRAEPVGEASVLITRFLEASLPYRTLYMNPGLERYRERLLDAIAGLLVRLHLAGFYWGDCSLSNTLFRRDAGELGAYLVDAETSELHENLSDGARRQDLMIMAENVAGELADLAISVTLPEAVAARDTGPQIRERYERLWSEITREESIAPGETYRIHERIRALNELGFTVGEVELIASGEGDRLSMRAIVTDRDYHHHRLHGITGIVAGDRQAALLLDEIHEMQATLSKEQGREVPLDAAAYRWLHDRYQPTLERLGAREESGSDPAELYCQVLEHKWFLSEREQKDVGLDTAIEDYRKRFRAA